MQDILMLNGQQQDEEWICWKKDDPLPILEDCDDEPSVERQFPIPAQYPVAPAVSRMRYQGVMARFEHAEKCANTFTAWKDTSKSAVLG